MSENGVESRHDGPSDVDPRLRASSPSTRPGERDITSVREAVEASSEASTIAGAPDEAVGDELADVPDAPDEAVGDELADAPDAPPAVSVVPDAPPAVSVVPDAPPVDPDAVPVTPAAARAVGPTDVGDDVDRDPPAPPLRKILEAILMVVDEPVPEVELAQVVEQPRVVVAEALTQLAASYVAEDRGFALRQVGAGWRLYTADACAPYVERFVLDGQQARLTNAALETLAVVAYRQPVGRAAIAAIRGVNVDGVVRTLLSRGLIAESAEEGQGGARLYVTTPYFLERLGLRSLDELPNLAPFLPTSLEEIEREL